MTGLVIRGDGTMGFWDGVGSGVGWAGKRGVGWKWNTEVSFVLIL